MTRDALIKEGEELFKNLEWFLGIDKPCVKAKVKKFIDDFVAKLEVPEVPEEKKDLLRAVSRRLQQKTEEYDALLSLFEKTRGVSPTSGDDNRPVLCEMGFHQIVKDFCRNYGYQTSKFYKSKSTREHRMVRIRAIVFNHCRLHYRVSLKSLGEWAGGYDHTTVLNLIKNKHYYGIKEIPDISNVVATTTGETHSSGTKTVRLQRTQVPIQVIQESK